MFIITPLGPVVALAPADFFNLFFFLAPLLDGAKSQLEQCLEMVETPLNIMCVYILSFQFFCNFIFVSKKSWIELQRE